MGGPTRRMVPARQRIHTSCSLMGSSAERVYEPGGIASSGRVTALFYLDFRRIIWRTVDIFHFCMYRSWCIAGFWLRTTMQECAVELGVLFASTLVELRSNRMRITWMPVDLPFCVGDHCVTVNIARHVHVSATLFRPKAESSRPQPMRLQTMKGVCVIGALISN